MLGPCSTNADGIGRRARVGGSIATESMSRSFNASAWLLDRWVDAVLLVGISIHYAREGAPQYVALAGLALATMVLVSYTKARAELVLPHFEVGLLERAERVVILAAGALFGLLVAALWIIAIGSAITAGQRIALAYREMQRLDDAEAKLLERP